MLDVHVLFEHGSDHVPYATSTLRLLRPLTHPSCGKSIKMTSGTSPRGIDADVIIVDRLWKPDVTLEEAEHLVKYTRSKDITLIYALDDYLLDLRNDLPPQKQPLNYEESLSKQRPGQACDEPQCNSTTRKNVGSWIYGYSVAR